MPLHNAKLRIIGGKFKGLKLEMLDSPLTRPTKAILKESLFNTLQNDIIDCGFIEGFGGSGSVGIEALSRGAKEAIFIESNPQSLKILKANLAKLKNIQTQIHLANTFDILPTLIQHIQIPSILYLDPPFVIRENMSDIYQKCFDLVAQINNPQIFLVVFECLSTYKMPQNLGNFCIIKQKKFGKSGLIYYTKE